MTCLCPKCKVSIELEHTQIPAEGMATKCASCSAKLQVIRESFARTAYHQTGEKCCALCGNQLGHTLHCPSCGVVYPDFLVAVDPVVIRRQAKERKRQHLKGSFQGISISLPTFKSSRAEKATPRYTPQRSTNAAKTASSAAGSRRLPILVISLLVMIAIIGGGYTAYARHKAEKLYLETYFKALYGIKAGEDLCNKTSTKLAVDWKSSLDTGRQFTPRISVEDETRLNKVKTEVQKLLQQLNPVPEKFATPHDNLSKLNDRFVQMHAITITPPSSLPALTDALGKNTSSFNRQAQDLKASFPEEMTAELQQAKQKYKPLKDF